MSKISKKLKRRKDIDQHLVYILRKSTPYQRMVWLEKAFQFWKKIKKTNLFKIKEDEKGV